MEKYRFGKAREVLGGSEQSERIKNLNLFELGKSGRHELKSRISKHKGLVRVFVHPFFKAPNIEKLPKGEIEKDMSEAQLVAMRRGLFKILSLSTEESPPVLIFEEEPELEKTFSRVSEICESSGNYPYIVPTIANRSKPTLRSGNLRQAMFMLAERQWAFLRSEMENLGVEKILLGGMNLKITVAREHPHWHLVNAPNKAIKNLFKRQVEEGKEWLYFFQHCVGEAFSELNLSKKIHVKLSNLAFPDSRRNYRQAK